MEGTDVFEEKLAGLLEEAKKTLKSERLEN